MVVGAEGGAGVGLRHDGDPVGGSLLPVQVTADYKAAFVVHFKEFVVLIINLFVLILVVLALKGPGGSAL